METGVFDPLRRELKRLQGLLRYCEQQAEQDRLVRSLQHLRNLATSARLVAIEADRLNALLRGRPVTLS